MRREKREKRIKAWTFTLLAAAALLSCGRENVLRVAVAANFSAAAEELKKEYEKLNPGKKVEIITGSSGKLAMQIIHGAPYDLFFSADMKRPGKLRERGLTTGRPLPYAFGRLILVRGKKEKGGMTLKKALEGTGERVILANPELAPYGKAAMEVLERAGLLANAKPRLIIAENVVQSARYALLGKGVSFTALSLLTSPAFREREGKISWIEVDKKLYGEIKQGVVIISKSENREAARSFLDFVLTGKEAKRIIRHYGYTPVEKTGRGKME